VRQESNAKEGVPWDRPRRTVGSLARLYGIWLALGLTAPLVTSCNAVTVVDLLPEAGSVGLGPTGVAGAPASTSGLAACTAAAGEASTLVEGLRNRYDFSGTGTMLCDLVEGRHGSIQGGAALDGSGTLGLDGVDDYVALPSGMVSRFASVTLVAWFTWRDPNTKAWSRVFDFGQTKDQDGVPGTSVAHFFFTPLDATGQDTASGTSANFSLNGNDQAYVNGQNPLPLGVQQQIAVVFDGVAARLASYVGGNAQGQADVVNVSTRATMSLRDLWDRNCWLGQSEWVQDAHMNGVYDEFRIYDRALTQAEIQTLLDAGPDQP
jgi:hypothetical protein